MEDNEILYLDQDGINDFQKSIDNLYVNLGRIEERVAILREKRELSTELDFLLSLREDIKKRIRDKKQKFSKIVLSEKDNNSNYADVGDIIRINAYYSDGVEEEVYELVVGDSDLDAELPKISIDSPKGHAIYKTNIGESNYFFIGAERVKIDVLEKVKNKTLIK